MQGGSPSTFEVTYKGEKALDRFHISASGTVMSFYEYGILRAAKEGLLINHDMVRRYGTEGSKVIKGLLKKKWMYTTPTVGDTEIES